MQAPEEIYLPHVDANSEHVKIIRISSPDIILVTPGDVILEFETSKAAIELPAQKSGFVKILVKENDEIEPGQVVALWSAHQDLFYSSRAVNIKQLFLVPNS